MLGGHVQAHQLKGRDTGFNALSPADYADYRIAGLGEGDPASTRHQPVTPAVLAVLDADPVEILLRNQVAVGLLPTLGLKPRDGGEVGKRGDPQLQRTLTLSPTEVAGPVMLLPE